MANLDKSEMLDDFDVDFENDNEDTFETEEDDDKDFFEDEDNESPSDTKDELVDFDTDDDIDFKEEDTSLELDGDLVTESDIEELNEEQSEVEKSTDNVDAEIYEENIHPEDIQEQEPEIQVQDVVLYIIIDRKIHGLLGYFRNYGVNVSKIFTDIAEARNTMLMQTELSRLVVIDTGTGKFTNMASRRELVDLMGICDEDTKISVFYTDSVIKSEISSAAEVDDKHIDWSKYKSTAVVLALLLQKTKLENYCVYEEDDEEDQLEFSDSFLDITGLPVKTLKSIDIGEPTLREEEIRINMSREAIGDSGLPGYKIKV